MRGASQLLVKIVNPSLFFIDPVSQPATSEAMSSTGFLNNARHTIIRGYAHYLATATVYQRCTTQHMSFE